MGTQFCSVSKGAVSMDLWAIFGRCAGCLLLKSATGDVVGAVGSLNRRFMVRRQNLTFAQTVDFVVEHDDRVYIILVGIEG